MKIKNILFLAILVVPLISCKSYYDKKALQYSAGREQIRNDCEAARLNRTYKSHYDTIIRCEEPRITEYMKQNKTNSKYLSAYYAKKAMLAEKLDKKQITKAQMKDELAQYSLVIQRMSDQVEAAKDADLLARQNILVNGLQNYNTQQMNNNNARRPLNCNTSTIYGTAHTTCN